VDSSSKIPLAMIQVLLESSAWEERSTHFNEKLSLFRSSLTAPSTILERFLRILVLDWHMLQEEGKGMVGSLVRLTVGTMLEKSVSIDESIKRLFCLGVGCWE